MPTMANGQTKKPKAAYGRRWASHHGPMCFNAEYQRSRSSKSKKITAAYHGKSTVTAGSEWTDSRGRVTNFPVSDDSPYLGPEEADMDKFVPVRNPCTICRDSECNDDHEGQLHDLVVIGAGPHALSLVCRLIDDEPDLWTETQRGRAMSKASERLNGHTFAGGKKAERREGGVGNTTRQVRAHLNKHFDGPSTLPGCVVVDSHGEWMGEWKQNFEALGIQTTRSHADFHPCPYDFKSLRVWAHQQNRESELYETRHLDKEASQGAGFKTSAAAPLYFNKTPYVLPSTSLFNDFCDSLVTRYNLNPLLRKGFVTEVNPIRAETGSEPCTFEVHLADGSVLKTRKVVSAVGPGPMFKGMRQNSPPWVGQLTADLAETEGDSSRIMHSQELVGWFQQGNAPPANARILIVGGGQTAAHLALKAAQAQCTVTLASRRNVNVRPFDLPDRVMGVMDGNAKSGGDTRLGVLGKDRADMLAKIHLRPPQERIDACKSLRGGGSVSPLVFQELLQLSSKHTADSDHTSSTDLPISEATAAQLGSVRLMEEVVVVKAGCNNAAEIQVQFDNGTESEFDYIWLATGGNLDFHAIPLFESLFKQWPIEAIGQTGSALPVLQPDLSWDVNCPFYILGAFAQVELGPDALNVAGARSGSVLLTRAFRRNEEKLFAITGGRRLRYYM